jgi:hypothetical protein
VPFKNRDEAAGWLAGMIDGEGHVRVGPARYVGVTNTDYVLIEALMEACALLGLRYRIDLKRPTNPSHAHAWSVMITGRESFLRLVDLPIRSNKAAKIREALALFRKPPVSREVLEQLYVFEGLSCREIVARTHANSARTVHHWLHQAGIPLRTPAEGARLYARNRKAK